MNCPNCLIGYNVLQHLPVITNEGQTLCKECFLVLNPIATPISNRQMIKLMGRCHKHLQSELSLFNVEDRKNYCPKCLIFCQDAEEREKYKKMQLIQIESNGDNKIDNALKKYQSMAYEKLERIRKEVLRKVSMAKTQTLKQVNQKIEKEYKKVIEELNERKIKEQSEINAKIQQTWSILWVQSLNDYKNWEEKYQSITQKSLQKELKQGEKYDGLAELSKINKIISEAENGLKNQGYLLCEEFKKYSQQFKSNLSFYNSDISLDLSKSFQSSKVEISTMQSLRQNIQHEEQLIAIQKEQITLSRQKIYEAFSLAMAESGSSMISMQKEQISTARTNLTLSNPLETTIIQQKKKEEDNSNSKSMMRLSHPQEINKIQTHIRQICAKKIEISNTDAKKILTKVSQSFVKSLDLSGNKLSSFFLKDLSKAQIGKYLKTIKLNGNQIDGKDPNIIKKIDQLKKDGVNIII